MAKMSSPEAAEAKV